jgi:hypothetical protein
MKRVAILMSLLALCVPFIALQGTAPAVAQSGGDYDLSWSSVDGGGGASSGGNYALSGTIGQPDANSLTGGEYTLGGAFWGGGALAGWYKVYLPVVARRVGASW